MRCAAMTTVSPYRLPLAASARLPFCWECAHAHTDGAHMHIFCLRNTASLWMAQTVHIYLQACNADSHCSLVGFCWYPADTHTYAVHMHVLPWEILPWEYILPCVCMSRPSSWSGLRSADSHSSLGRKGFNRKKLGNEGAMHLPHGCIDRTSRAHIELSYSAGLLCAQPLHRRLLVGGCLSYTW